MDRHCIDQKNGAPWFHQAINRPVPVIGKFRHNSGDISLTELLMLMNIFKSLAKRSSLIALSFSYFREIKLLLLCGSIRSKVA